MGRTIEAVDTLIYRLTGYVERGQQQQLDVKYNFVSFFNQATLFTANTSMITGAICGYCVENIENPLVQKIRNPDKLVDELAKGKSEDVI